MERIYYARGWGANNIFELNHSIKECEGAYGDKEKVQRSVKRSSGDAGLCARSRAELDVDIAHVSVIG